MTRQKINPPDKLLIPWHQVDTVMLDMDGTLLDLHYDNHFWLHHVPFCYARKLGITTAQAWSILEPEMLRIQGTLDWYSVDYWSEQLQLDITAMKANLADRIGFRPHAELFLETLTRAGKHCWLVTNAHPKSLQLKCQITGIDRFFEVIISAHELGLAKEQAEFWQRLHSRHAFQLYCYHAIIQLGGSLFSDSLLVAVF